MFKRSIKRTAQLYLYMYVSLGNKKNLRVHLIMLNYVHGYYDYVFCRLHLFFVQLPIVCGLLLSFWFSARRYQVHDVTVISLT